jgi:hypothetical protein
MYRVHLAWEVFELTTLVQQIKERGLWNNLTLQSLYFPASRVDQLETIFILLVIYL